MKRSIYRTVSAGSSFGGNPLRQHIGVGRRPGRRARVYWPTSDTRQVFRDVAVGGRYAVTEGSAELRSR